MDLYMMFRRGFQIPHERACLPPKSFSKHLPALQTPPQIRQLLCCASRSWADRIPELLHHDRLLLGRQHLPGVRSLIRGFTTRIPEIRACALLDIA
jgi:hypothetical protein